MKLLGELIGKDVKHLLFIDYEGTQFDHEIIAIGAVLVDVDENAAPCSEPSNFKCYIKPASKVGSVITTMTGITEEFLKENGISFVQAMKDLSLFLGERTNNIKVVTYGNQDKRMLTKSFEMWNDGSSFLFSFVNYLNRNNIDISPFFAKYIRGSKNNLISLIHLREFFSIPSSGNSHDPLVDSLDLYNVYKEFSSNKDKILSSYLLLLENSDLLVEPVRRAIVRVIKGNTLSKEEFVKILEEYFK